MGKYGTKKEVLDALNSKTDILTAQYQVYHTAIDELADIFTTGLEYTDPNTSEKKVSLGTKKESQTDLFKSLYGSGSETLIEAARPGSTQVFMTWFCRSKGITAEQLMSLSAEPDKPETKRLREQLAGMKQEFRALITSNDPERLSAFYMSVFRAYEQDLPKVLHSGNADAVIENLPCLLSWGGVTAALQQSLENAGSRSNDTQKALIGNLNDALKTAYGEDVELHDVMATMHPCMSLLLALENDWYTHHGKKCAELDEEELPGRQTSVADKLRMFHVLQSYADERSREGDPLRPFAPEMGKAASVGMYGYQDLETDGYQGINLIQDATMISDLRALLGDESGIPLYDSLHVADYPHTNPESPLSYGPDEAAQHRFLDAPQLQEDYYHASNGNIGQIVARKMASGERLTRNELIFCTSDENPEFSAKDRELYRAVLSRDPGTPVPDQLDPKLAFLLESASQLKFRMSLEGLLQSRETRMYYAEKAVYEADSVLPDAAFHTKKVNELKAARDKAGSTIFSSGEFQALDEALNRLGTPEAGKEAAYRAQLKALAEAADHYISAKNADGKLERTTQRGKDRMEFARRAKAFADMSLNGMDGVQNAIQSNSKTLNDAPVSRQNTYVETINRRIDALLGPKTSTLDDLNQLGIRNATNYTGRAIMVPENCPFTDHEIAVCGLALLTDGAMLRKTDRNNPLLSDFELGAQLRVHTTTDILVTPRGHESKSVLNLDEVREMSMSYIRAYMEGNTKPLAQAIGSNIRTCVTSFMGCDELQLQNRGDYTCLSEAMKLLRTHPELMKDSGLTSREVTEARFFERAGVLIDRKEAAQETLNRENATAEEKRQAVQDIAILQLVNKSYLADWQSGMNTPEYKAYTAKLSTITHESAKINQKKIEYENQGGNDALTLKEFDDELTDAGYRRDRLQCQSELFFAARPLSGFIQFLGGKGAFEGKLQALEGELQKTAALKKPIANTADALKIASEAAKEVLQNSKRQLDGVSRNGAVLKQPNQVPNLGTKNLGAK